MAGDVEGLGVGPENVDGDEAVDRLAAVELDLGLGVGGGVGGSGFGRRGQKGWVRVSLGFGVRSKCVWGVW